MKNTFQKGWRFENYEAPNKSPFDKLFEIFQELITHTSGDVDEALDWYGLELIRVPLTEDGEAVESGYG